MNVAGELKLRFFFRMFRLTFDQGYFSVDRLPRGFTWLHMENAKFLKKRNIYVFCYLFIWKTKIHFTLK